LTTLTDCLSNVYGHLSRFVQQISRDLMYCWHWSAWLRWLYMFDYVFLHFYVTNLHWVSHKVLLCDPTQGNVVLNCMLCFIDIDTIYLLLLWLLLKYNLLPLKCFTMFDVWYVLVSLHFPIVLLIILKTNVNFRVLYVQCWALPLHYHLHY